MNFGTVYSYARYKDNSLLKFMDKPIEKPLSKEECINHLKLLIDNIKSGFLKKSASDPLLLESKSDKLYGRIHNNLPQGSAGIYIFSKDCPGRSKEMVTFHKRIDTEIPLKEDKLFDEAYKLLDSK